MTLRHPTPLHVSVIYLTVITWEQWSGSIFVKLLALGLYPTPLISVMIGTAEGSLLFCVTAWPPAVCQEGVTKAQKLSGIVTDTKYDQCTCVFIYKHILSCRGRLSSKLSSLCNRADKSLHTLLLLLILRRINDGTMHLTTQVTDTCCSKVTLKFSLLIISRFWQQGYWFDQCVVLCDWTVLWS